MHYVIVGCGRVGSSLARAIESRGHTVAIIDHDPASFALLSDSFGGKRVRGIGFDRDTLVSAGIEGAAGLAAVSSGDNTNIIAARVAREEFGLRAVVARIYDPRRAEVYERLGIATVAAVRWTTAQVMGRLLPGSPHHEYQDISGTLSMISIDAHASWVGRPLSHLEERTGGRIAHITRLGEGLLPRADLRLQEGDRLHLMVRTADIPMVESLLLHPREEEGEA